MGNNGFEGIYDGMNYNYGQLLGVLDELYQQVKTNPNNEMARYLFTKLSTIAENMIYSQKEVTSYYGDPAVKNSLMNGLDAKIEALHAGQRDLPQPQDTPDQPSL